MLNSIPIGLDLGASEIKATTPAGDIRILAHVARATKTLVNQAVFGIGGAPAPLQVEVGHERFYVGAGAHDYGRAVEDWAHDRFDSAPLRALVYATLIEAQERLNLRGPFSVVLGLPQGIATGEGAEARKNAAKGWLLEKSGIHKIVTGDNEYQFQVSDVAATSQVFGAYVDAATTDGAMTKGERGFASVGFNTLEFNALRDGKPMAGRAAGPMLGVRRLLEMAQPGVHRTAGELDARLRVGNINLNGQVSSYAREVLAAVAETWGEVWRDWDSIVFVGGGAKIIEKQLRAHFGDKLIIPQDPTMSIAHGLYRMASQRVENGTKA